MCSTILVVTLLFGCFIHCHGYPTYLNEIPNGRNVKHPCKLNTDWNGVGHEYSGGGGKRNRFGQDFSKYRTWSKEFCRKDSDEDGLTNGEELGDPQCVWQKGNTPQRSVNITHPGVCNAMSTSHCKSINTFIDCNVADFSCPAINAVGTKSKDVRFPQTSVPDKVTSYFCMYFEFPKDADYHLVATEPYINNTYVTHHIIIYGCNDKVQNDSRVKMNQPSKCGMFIGDCQDLVASWTVGHPGSCSHKDTGFRIGTEGYKIGMMQIHWNNPERRDNYSDSSGLKLYYEPRQRPYDSGVFIVGQTFIEIPPFQKNFVVNGACNKDCTSKLFKKPFNVTTAANHMHYKGRQEKVTLHRSNTAMPDIQLAYDEVFEYDNPVVHTFNTPLVVHPNDEIKISCIYDSLNSSLTTEFGEATADEMCFGFITYYPKDSISTPQCLSWKSLPLCNVWSGETVDGCNVREMFNINNPETMKFGMDIMGKCQPFVNCTPDCLEAYKPYENHTCLQGDVGYMIRSRSSRTKMMAMIFLGIDSCAVEIYNKTHPCDMPPKYHHKDAMIKECNLEEIFNQNSPKAQSLSTSVKEKCKRLQSCRHECLALLHEIYRDYPCLRGSQGDQYKIKAKSDNFLYDIFSRLDSCKVEYYKSVSPCERTTTTLSMTTLNLNLPTTDFTGISAGIKNTISIFSVYVLITTAVFLL